MNVLSLFDGMSCGQIALNDMGLKPTKYYASEIDKAAIKQTMFNFPETIQLGSVTEIKAVNLPKIDLLIGGSPCQGFSFAGKQLNFNDPRSSLFFEFVRIWKEVKAINPNAKFLLENVNMKKEYLRVISEHLGVFPVRINSNLVSAQNRDRWYWTNIKTKHEGLFSEVYSDIPQPTDRKIYLKDILQPENEVDKSFIIDNPKMFNYITNEERLQKKHAQINGFKAIALMEKQNQSWCGNFVCVAMHGRNPENPNDRTAGTKKQQTIEAKTDGKTNCLTSVQKDNLVLQLNTSKESGGVQPYQQNRVYHSSAKMVALNSSLGGRNNVLIPEANKKGFTEIKPGECFDFENPNSKTRRGRKMETKSNCLMSKTTDFLHLNNNFQIRRLTPLECSRLQTIPSWYKWNCSNTQIYKMLGNGWTVEIIKHIFSFL